MTKYNVMDANEAVANVAYKFTEIAGIYPITPASPIAEKIDVLSNKGEINFFGNKVKIVEMESEKGAVATVHGALQSGVLASTFTASQGLLLMIPTLYKLAGEMLPGVIHVAARSLSTHSLSIFGDHQDIYAARSTGVCMLSSSSVEEAYHMAMIAHLSSIKASLPFINFFDGFRTSHEINKFKEVDLSKISNLIDKKALNKFRDRALNNSNPNTRGTAENEDIYFQNMEVRNKDYDNAIDVVDYYMKKINGITKKNYKPFNYYGSSTAKEIIVAMGSVCECIEETIDKLNNDDNVNGILVQLPLPKEINEKNVVEAIDPVKDVDGLTTLNVGKLFNGQSGLVPCTALGIIKMLDEEDIDIEGKNVVIIGRSSLVGMPLSGLFLNRNATVTVCHSKTLGLKKIASNADILVVAIGKKEFITSEYVKDGAVVIDVGINRYDNKLYGDCKFDEIYDKCRLITPVPGGVGPLTVVMLGYNTLRAYYLQKNK